MKKPPEFDLNDKCYACRQEFNRFKGHFRVSKNHSTNKQTSFTLFFSSSTIAVTAVRACALSAQGKELL